MLRRLGAMMAVAAVMLPVAGEAQERAVPYWAAITAGDALMRSGPGRNFPAVWRYRRAGLPVQVIQIHESWRKIREIDGTEGWMAAALLTAERTAMVTGGTQPMRASPDGSAAILWRAESGVIGRLRHCSGGWCQFDVGGRTGYIATDHLWGVAPGEEVE